MVHIKCKNYNKVVDKISIYTYYIGVNRIEPR